MSSDEEADEKDGNVASFETPSKFQWFCCLCNDFVFSWIVYDGRRSVQILMAWIQTWLFLPDHSETLACPKRLRHTDWGNYELPPNAVNVTAMSTSKELSARRWVSWSGRMSNQITLATFLCSEGKRQLDIFSGATSGHCLPCSKRKK